MSEGRAKRYTLHDGLFQSRTVAEHKLFTGKQSVVLASDYDENNQKAAATLLELQAVRGRIRELEAIVRRFVAFDPYPDSALTKEARALLATADQRGEALIQWPIKPADRTG